MVKTTTRRARNGAKRTVPVVSHSRRRPMGKKGPRGSGKADLRGIVQGVGAPLLRKNAMGAIKVGVHGAFNAFSQTHMPLPRAVGGYTVIRTVGVLTSNAQVALFGPTSIQDTTRGAMWSSIYAVTSVAEGTAVRGASNAYVASMDSLTNAGLDDALLTPAAFSVQIMNGGAISSTSGMYFMGRAPNQLIIRDQPETWNSMANSLLNYAGARQCSAAKLAFRGVQADAVPYDMNALADFTPRKTDTSGAETLDSTSTRAFRGFNPIWVFNMNKVETTYMVCIEWRCRFDATENPAASNHHTFPPTTDAAWAAAIKQLEHSAPIKDMVETMSGSGRDSAY